MTLSKGSVVYLSEVGHKGFFYPSSKTAILLFETICQTVSWISIGGKKAYLIPQNAILHSSRDSMLMPIWVKED
jgi:hypothetical protein